MIENLQSGFRVGGWEVYPQENLLKGPDRECVLEPKVMDVLVFLACRQGEVVSREQVLDAVWPDSVVGDESVSRAIHVLRLKLGDSPKAPHFLKTIWKRGYCLIADVIPAAEKSIAVLPFVNMSSDEDQEYFSDGIAEEILNLLAPIKELKVAGRTSSFAFKGKEQDLRRIGSILGVQHILDGSVRKSGVTVRITAQLVQVEDGFQVWSQTYERELTDIFAIQDEIATEILTQLKAHLLDKKQQLILSRRTDSEVYDLYLLANQRLYSRTRQSIESAIDLLDQAISKDQNYAPAYAERGIATLMLSDRSYGTISEADAQKQGKRYIDAALEMDPELAEAWAGLGLYHLGQPTEHNQAIEALTKALAINPNLIDASNWLQDALHQSGKPRGALRLLEQMTRRDPLYRPGFGNAVRRFNIFGQEGKAQALIDQFRAYEPNDVQLLHVDAIHHFAYGRTVDGIRMAERAYQLRPTDAAAYFAFTIGLIMTLQVERLVEEGLDFFKVDALDLLGRRDEAFELAFKLSGKGHVGYLLVLYNRADRSQELLDFIRGHWRNLEAFAADYPYDKFGYDLMTEVAFAFSRTGDAKCCGDALLRLERTMSELTDQGVDNWRFMLEKAKYLAIAKQYDDAINLLKAAVNRGMRMYAPIATYISIFEPLRDDPRFIAIESDMVRNINLEREEIGLKPVDPFSQFWQ